MSDVFVVEGSTQSHPIESSDNGLVQCDQLIIDEVIVLNPQYLDGLSMLKHDVVFMVFSSLGYSRGSNFYHQLLYDAKPEIIRRKKHFRLCLESIEIDFQRFSSIRMEPSSLAIE